MNISATTQSPDHVGSQFVVEYSPPSGIRETMASLSDDTLVSRTRTGDQWAFQELLGRYENNLFRLARRYVRNRQDAEDVLQDVMVTTWRKLPTFEDRSQIGSWLYRVTVNAALMHLRERSRRPKFVDVAIGGHSFDMMLSNHEDNHSPTIRPDTHFESQELVRTIQRAINMLPESLYAVIDLRMIQGRSTRQTARMLGISEAAVKARAHRARLILRNEIEKYLVQ